MRYLLVIGFECDVYRREPRARIFFGDKLIDEFNIQHNKITLFATRRYLQQDKTILQPYSKIELTNAIVKSFPILRFYELEIDKKLDQTNLFIEIKNDDNNYTNGFMSRCTLIQLRVCHFFPFHEKLLLRLNEIAKKNRPRQNYAWYRSDKNEIFDLLSDNRTYWQGKDNKISMSNHPVILQVNKIGGDGVFRCELVKKYQMLINKTKKANRYHFYVMLVDYFITKYRQHANQRNSN